MDIDSVFMQAEGESPMDTVVRVLRMPLHELSKRKDAIKRLRTRLNERARAQVATWVQDARGGESWGQRVVEAAV